LFDLAARFFIPTYGGWRRRAQEPSRMARERHCKARPWRLRARRHTCGGRDDDVRGEPALWQHESSCPHPCMRWVRNPDHDAVMRIGSELRGGGPILHNGIKAVVLAGTPPPRTVIGDRRKRADRRENRQAFLC